MKISKLLGFILAFTMMLTISVSAVEYGEEYQNQPTKIYSQKFSDVPKTHWAFDYIAEMTERGVLNGYPDGKFYPENNITRAEFAKIMTVASGMIIDMSDTDTIYTDVFDDDWFAPYVRCAQDYLNGFGTMTGFYFRPNQLAVREDIVVAIVKLKGYSAYSVDTSMLSTMFTDSDSISLSAERYVAIAIERGIISGYEDGTFRGQSSISRAEAAAILWRAFQYGNDNKEFDYISTPQPTNIPAIEATERPTIEPTLVPTLRPTETPTPRPTNTPIPTPTPEPTATPTPTPEPKGWDVYTIGKSNIVNTQYRMGHDMKNDIIYYCDHANNAIMKYDIMADEFEMCLDLNSIYRLCDTGEWLFEDPGTERGNYYKDFICMVVYYDNYSGDVYMDLVSSTETDIGGLNDISEENTFSVRVKNGQWTQFYDLILEAESINGSCEYGVFTNYELWNWNTINNNVRDMRLSFDSDIWTRSSILVSGNNMYCLSATQYYDGRRHESELYRISLSDMEWESIRRVGLADAYAWSTDAYYIWQDDDRILKCDLDGNLSILLELEDIEIHDFMPIDDIDTIRFIVTKDERCILVQDQNTLRVIRKR